MLHDYMVCYHVVYAEKSSRKKSLSVSENALSAWPRRKGRWQRWRFWQSGWQISVVFHFRRYWSCQVIFARYNLASLNHQRALTESEMTDQYTARNDIIRVIPPSFMAKPEDTDGKILFPLLLLYWERFLCIREPKIQPTQCSSAARKQNWSV